MNPRQLYFDATVSDGEFSDTKTVTVNVIDVNETPTIRDYKWAPVLSSEDGIVPIVPFYR